MKIITTLGFVIFSILACVGLPTFVGTLVGLQMNSVPAAALWSAMTTMAVAFFIGGIAKLSDK